MCAFPTVAIDRFIDPSGSPRSGLPCSSDPCSERLSSMTGPSGRRGMPVMAPHSDPSSGSARLNGVLMNGGHGTPSALSRDLAVTSGAGNGIAAGARHTKIIGASLANGKTQHGSSEHAESPAVATPDSRSPSQGLGQSFYDEFFDAADESFSECSSDDDSSKSHIPGRSPSRSIHRDMAARLHEEVTKRIAAEDALNSERQRREELVGFLKSVGASLPPGFTALPQNGSAVHDLHASAEKNGLSTGSFHFYETELADLREGGGITGNGASGKACNGTPSAELEDSEIVVARMVAQAVSRGIAAAAAGEEMERLLLQKEKEMARLKDKMLFWERMNQELANQTQESMEIQRRQRKRRQTLQKVALASLGVLLGVGISAAIAYAFYPWDSPASSTPLSSENGADTGDFQWDEGPPLDTSPVQGLEVEVDLSGSTSST